MKKITFIHEGHIKELKILNTVRFEKKNVLLETTYV